MLIYNECVSDFLIKLEITCWLRENERIKWEIKWSTVQSPSEVLEKESKNYKYAQSEREAGHLPRNKHEATLCCSQIWALAAILENLAKLWKNFLLALWTLVAILEKLDDTRENLLIQQRRRGEQLDLSC